MKLSRKALFEEMGMSPTWVLREPPAFDTVPASQNVVEAPVATPVERAAVAPVEIVRVVDGVSEPVDSLGWEALRQRIAECRACGLCDARKQTVPGVGDEHADWLFIGEGPGAEEDARGEPFVGQAGKLLDAMLAAIDLERGQNVYIANAVKCRPPNNRTPEPDEMTACWPYLQRQIALIRPKLIVLLGRAAVFSVLREDKSLASLRGKTLSYKDASGEIPVVVSYHPAYLLRNLPDKAKAWEDLCRARAMMRRLSGAA